MNLIDTRYGQGDVVYISTDEYQLPRMVTAITIRGPLVTYELSCGSNMPSWHMECELTTQKDVLKEY